MKSLTILLISFFSISVSNVQAQTKQSVKKETVKVWGNCDMCQTKIEKAAKAAGATTAAWDVDSKILSVSYNPSKSSIQKIEKAVAAAGYDTKNEAGIDEAYNKLHGCCQYDRKGATVEGQDSKKD